jgi:hypothetical protein
MRYLGEFYLPDHEADLAHLAARARAAAVTVSQTGLVARFIHVIHAPADECCFALYEAESMAAVQAAGALAGITFDRLVEVATTDGGVPGGDLR